ncbi:hypothetical protein OAG30_00555 [Flavobacteriaceae bacterium]|nr:hypothetical protein [Flavobacteriaceae bacterium]
MIKIIPYRSEFYNRWNNFIDQSLNGTLFHRLDFLKYHGDKFKQEEHHLMILKGEEIIGVLPAVKRDNTLVSPYGSSFGGLVISKKCSLQNAIEVANCLKKYLNDSGITQVEFISSPNHYYAIQNHYMTFALEKIGFKLVSSEVFNFIELPKTEIEFWENKYQPRGRTTYRKYKSNFSVHANASLDDFYPILLEDKMRHNSSPTHSKAELYYLTKNFTDKIWFDIATHLNGSRVGICYFKPTPSTILTFYMAQETGALRLNGKNVLVDYGIRKAINAGIKFFDFGGSTLAYDIQNIGVANFKESFGAIGALRKKYVLTIN